MYDKVSPFLYLQPNMYGFFYGGIIIQWYGRIAGCGENSVLVLSKVTHRHNITKKDFIDIELDKVGFYTEDSSFNHLIKYAKSIGERLAQNEYQELFINSSLFRKAINHDELTKLTKTILEKHSKSIKVPSYEYPLWEFELDKNKLIDEAMKYNIEPDYIEKLLTYKTDSTNDGILLLYYRNYFSFACQWVAINIALLILAFLIRNKWYLINEPIVQKWGPPSFITFINLWIFSSKLPQNMEVKYWIIPSLIAVLVVYIVSKMYLMKSNRK